jgi:hypothetical protein
MLLFTFLLALHLASPNATVLNRVPSPWHNTQEGAGRHTIQLPINLPNPQSASSLLGSPLLYRLHAIYNTRCLRAILLEHLTQLLHHAPKMIHVRLLAAAGEAIYHWNAVLLASRLCRRAADRAAAAHAVGLGL